MIPGPIAPFSLSMIGHCTSVSQQVRTRTCTHTSKVCGCVPSYLPAISPNDPTARGNWPSKMKVREGMKKDKAGSEIQTECKWSYKRNNWAIVECWVSWARGTPWRLSSQHKKGKWLGQNGWSLPEDMAQAQDPQPQGLLNIVHSTGSWSKLRKLSPTIHQSTERHIRFIVVNFTARRHCSKHSW